MKLILPLLLCLLAPALSRADDLSHRAMAGKLLDAINGPELIRSAFVAQCDPLLNTLKAQGVPAPAIEEMRAAMLEWFDQEIKWDELKPKVAELYVSQFSEQELTEIVAFYQTPTGRKTITALPELFQKGAMIGQQYVMTKQASLQLRLQQIAQKYQLQAQAAPGARPAPAAP